MRKKMTPRVTKLMVEEEMNNIEEGIEPRIVTFEALPEGLMTFSVKRDAIDVNLAKIVEHINRFPEVDWRALLKRMVGHELAHRNQVKFLFQRGVGVEQLRKPHYNYLMEFQVHQVVPHPFWRQAFLRDLRKMTFEQVEELLEKSSMWADSVMAFSREGIREIFGPHDADELMLKMKDIADRVKTKEDIIRYAPEMKKLILFGNQVGQETQKGGEKHEIDSSGEDRSRKQNSGISRML